MKVSELTGPALDWAVAKCEYPEQPINTALGVPYLMFGRFNPSTNWSQGGPIIEREKIGVVLSPGDANVWVGSVYEPDWKFNRTGPTPLTAAMRCYVAARLGDEVDVPDEFTGG